MSENKNYKKNVSAETFNGNISPLVFNNVGITPTEVKYQLDIDTMVLWTLHQCYGWGAARLKKFYVAMMKEHLRMREFYELDDLYPERHKLKEKGVDVEAWYDEFFDEKGNFKTSGDAFDEPTDEEGKKN